ncbi:uncharacterized protein HKW66_Vig0085670 [Vigna angularis]|uniref:Uncharacterized protein n=1 Tax=Phaseolus angularis TaxID=3914 RepID=A0A8T0KIT8_PHAAN|nr:uncharacterized protein HKW66_Vig0085670 [Vigna angularis]
MESNEKFRGVKRTMKVQEENNEVQEEAPFRPTKMASRSLRGITMLPPKGWTQVYEESELQRQSPSTTGSRNRFVTLAISERHTTTATTTAPPTYNQHTTKAPKWRRKRKELESEMENAKKKNRNSSSWKVEHGTPLFNTQSQKDKSFQMPNVTAHSYADSN